MTDTVPPPPPAITDYRSVLTMIREHAHRTPAQDCLVAIDQNTALTWQQLYRLTNKLSAWLHSQGIGANDRVLALTDNSLENLLLYYGVQRHGATFCTVNIDINAHHMREIIDRLNPKIVLWHDSLDLSDIKETAPGKWFSFGTADTNAKNADDDGLFEALNALDGDTEPDEVSTAEDNAVICFTSGTTDRPKGVIHSFGNYNAIGAQTAYLWGLTGDDRVLEYRSFSWSSSHQIVLQPLLFGGGCVVFATKFSFSRLFSWIRDYRITKAIGIPTVVNMLLNQPKSEETDFLETLEFMSCSTAPLIEKQHRCFEDIYHIKLIQHYGMSEGGTVAGNHHLARRIGSVGNPGIGQNLTIVDKEGRSLPPGEEGEIEIGGPQNATAYINPDGAIEPVRGKRLKTGDMGILDVDGYLRVTGRAKELIIRGGVNIAPLEIDNIVMQHDDVMEVCTISTPDAIYGEAAVCYVVPRRGRAITADDIVQHCAALLPDFKQPSEIVITDKIDRNSRGKVDRNSMKDTWLETHPEAPQRI